MRRADRLRQQPLVKHRYYMLNKPVGCVSACRDKDFPTVLDVFPESEREGLFPMGRLDKNTEGLLLVTDDGKLNRYFLNPENHLEKCYRLWAAGELTAAKIALLESGISITGRNEPLKPAKIRLLQQSALGALPVRVFENRQTLADTHPDATAFCAELILTEGKRHQVKRMLEAVGCQVVYLKRIRFGSLMLDASLSPGEYRPLTESEIQILCQKP